MTTDFWIGVIFGLLVGGTLGAIAMAILAAGSGADAHIDRSEDRRGGD